jgi:hypothetical protein
MPVIVGVVAHGSAWRDDPVHLEVHRVGVAPTAAPREAPTLEDRATQADLRKRLKSAWPNPANNGYILSVGDRPYLLVASAVRDPAGRRAATVIGGFDAAYLVDQASRAAWMVVTISYVLLVIVGWNAWRQLHDSLATRIRAITMQLRLGIADDAAPTLSADGHELKDLADSVSNYIRQTLDQQQSNEERYRRLIELAPGRSSHLLGRRSAVCQSCGGRAGRREAKARADRPADRPVPRVREC